VEQVSARQLARNQLAKMIIEAVPQSKSASTSSGRRDNDSNPSGARLYQQGEDHQVAGYIMVTMTLW
jgi:hypothetical protein